MADSAGMLFKFGVFHPVQLLVLLTTVAFIVRVPLRAWWIWTISAAGGCVFVVQTLVEWPGGCDLDHFYVAGQAIRAGANPYQHSFAVWPPTGFPIFAALASLPFAQTLAIWTALNVVGFAALVVVAQRTLRAVGGDQEWHVPVHGIALLTAAIMLSVSCRYGMDMGQLSLFTAVAIMLSLWARQRQHPILAAVGLALASVKAATMVPFLLLLRRRHDLATWVALPVACVALYLLAGPPGDMFSRLGDCLRNISALSEPGRMNDMTLVINADMVALDRSIYFLGVDDRGVVRVVQLLVLLGLGGWVAWQVWRPGYLSEPAACALVAFYAALFFYHRLYDMPILAFPLLYATARARMTDGRARWCYAASALAVLGVMYVRLEAVKALSYAPRSAPLLEAVVVPYGTWLTVAGLLCLAAAERALPRTAAGKQAATFRAAA